MNPLTKDALKNDDPKEGMDDKAIDQGFKRLLSERRYGQILSPDIVAHLDFFMNTLNFEHKINSENPFDHPEKYPAFSFNEFEVDGDAIMESDEASSHSG